jgi:SAM-dependent methyltransferase
VHVLEIGAGYGLACNEALKLGAEHYTANDLDVRHLKILARDIKEINPDYLANITLIAGEFPNKVEFLSQRYDAILIARVLHFMTPDKVMTTLKAIYKILKPGGRVYAVMLSLYVRGYTSFIPEFERRIQSKSPFPGYVENLADFADKTIISEKALKNMEKSFLFFDVRAAQCCFEGAGFKVETTLEMPLAYKSQIWQLNGRENIEVIAQKPVTVTD